MTQHDHSASGVADAQGATGQASGTAAARADPTPWVDVGGALHHVQADGALDRGFLADTIRRLSDGRALAEMDRDYYRALVDGSWPDADKVIARVRTLRAAASVATPEPAKHDEAPPNERGAHA